MLKQQQRSGVLCDTLWDLLGLKNPSDALILVEKNILRSLVHCCASRSGEGLLTWTSFEFAMRTSSLSRHRGTKLLPGIHNYHLKRKAVEQFYYFSNIFYSTKIKKGRSYNRFAILKTQYMRYPTFNFYWWGEGGLIFLWIMAWKESTLIFFLSVFMCN